MVFFNPRHKTWYKSWGWKLFYSNIQIKHMDINLNIHEGSRNIRMWKWIKSLVFCFKRSSSRKMKSHSTSTLKFELKAFTELEFRAFRGPYSWPPRLLVGNLKMNLQFLFSFCLASGDLKLLVISKSLSQKIWCSDLKQ